MAAARASWSWRQKTRLHSPSNNDGGKLIGNNEVLRRDQPDQAGGTSASSAGTKGNDRLDGGAGEDKLDGGPGDDPSLEGGPGRDTVFGGAGSDTASGGAGDGDVVRGDSGEDRLDGGPGAQDIVSYASVTTVGDRRSRQQP